MSVSVGDFVRLTAKMKLFGTEDVQNVLTYRVDVNTTGDDATLMVEAALFLDIAYTLINPFVSTVLTYTSVDGQNISKNELLPETPWPVLTGGLNASNLLPTQVAACVFWPTITPKVRTSIFLGGFTGASNGLTAAIEASLLTVLATFGAAIKDWNTANVDAVKGSFNPVALLFTPAGDPVVPARWRTQRRRRVGVGS